MTLVENLVSHCVHQTIYAGMPDTQLLHIALQDGFYNNTVKVFVDEEERASRSNVTSKTQIGLAGTVELQLLTGQHALQVSVVGRPTSEVLTIELTQPLYVGVSVSADGKIVYTRSESPFRYA